MNGLSITCLPPYLNQTEVNFSVDFNTKKILFGLSAVNTINQELAQNIVSERIKHGKFTNFIDFLVRTLDYKINKLQLEKLIFAGVFDEFENNRSRLFFNLDNYFRYFKLVSAHQHAKSAITIPQYLPYKFKL
jgi:DNA polymerase-3 subunit alpha